MRQAYQVQISVSVNDLAELREYAMERALTSGCTKHEFEYGEAEAAEDNIEYWLTWAFDAGTPEGCGFEIEDSQTVYEGNV
ncbi:MAG: hypothetical protein KGJ13_09525 [Patescibacteria group bacterium]|nr:hypothetical protein [Patescibacteria group bacterium]